MMRTMRNIALAAIFTTTTIVGAQDWRVMLTPEQEQRLNPRAMELYREAALAIDHINYDEAAQLLGQAAEAQPNHIGLQFLAASRARNRAEIYYSAASYTPPPESMTYSSPKWRTSEPFIDIARASLLRLQNNPDLGTEEKERLESAIQTMEQRVAAIRQRDAARFETAYPLVQEIRAARLELELRGNPLDPQPDPLDPATPFIRKALEQQAAAKKATETGVDKGLLDELNPFKALPGEWRESFLPPPPPPPQAANPQNPFGAPPGIGPPGAEGGFDPTAGGGGAPADPMDGK